MRTYLEIKPEIMSRIERVMEIKEDPRVCAAVIFVDNPDADYPAWRVIMIDGMYDVMLDTITYTDIIQVRNEIHGLASSTGRELLFIIEFK